MRKLVIGSVVCILLIAIAALSWGRSFYQRHVVLKALEIAQGDPACFFDGRFNNGGMPVARPVPQDDDFLTLWPDFRNKVILSEPAKPFHVGIFVVRGSDTNTPTGEAWGWSYRKGTFWTARLEGFFSLAYSGDPINDCLKAQQ
ncbi:hypothetical protein [Yoonia sp.]|uniref:hypothetical protein n=1 Tax=Yoonia sp. TaxID=2212373 RepID=UPI00326663AB